MGGARGGRGSCPPPSPVPLPLSPSCPPGEMLVVLNALWWFLFCPTICWLLNSNSPTCLTCHELHQAKRLLERMTDDDRPTTLVDFVWHLEQFKAAFPELYRLGVICYLSASQHCIMWTQFLCAQTHQSTGENWETPYQMRNWAALPFWLLNGRWLSHWTVKKWLMLLLLCIKTDASN